ncbi:MAG: DsrE family protein [Pseudomonadota bacterium]
MTTRLLKPLLLAAGLAFAAASPAAGKPDDRVALQGIEAARVVWDVTTADPQRLNTHLALVGETWDDLQRQKIKPEMVFAFREGSVRILSEDTGLLPFEVSTDAEQARERLARLSARPGVRMEACAISMRGHGVEADTLPPWVSVVGNTFNSIIGRAPKGFAVITLP